MRVVGATPGRVVLATLILAAAAVHAATFEVNYVPPAAGVTLTVSAPEPTSTPLVVFVQQGRKARIAALLGNGLFRGKHSIVDSRVFPEIARNPNVKALPTEADVLVPVGERTTFVVRSHDEFAGGSLFGGAYTTSSCATPFVLEARAGYRYKATYTRSSDACALRVTERPLEPADAPETTLFSAEQPAATH